jgi:hypothetical protein
LAIPLSRTFAEPMHGAAAAVAALASACEWYTRPCTLQRTHCLLHARLHCGQPYCTGRPSCGAWCPHSDWTAADANLPLPDALRT